MIDKRMIFRFNYFMKLEQLIRFLLLLLSEHYLHFYLSQNDVIGSFNQFSFRCFASLIFFFVEKALSISEQYFSRSAHGFYHSMNPFRNSPSESFKMKTFILIVDNASDIHRDMS